MNKYFAINDHITDDTLTAFYSAVNGLGPDDHLNIMLSSGGGRLSVSKAITQAINNEPERFTLHAIEYIYSAAFNLFFDVTCYRIISPGTLGSSHQSIKSVQLKADGKAYYENNEFEQKEAKTEIIWDMQRLIGLGVDRKKVNSLKRGKDVYFTYFEMFQMLQNSISLNAGAATVEPVTDSSTRKRSKDGGLYGGNYTSSLTI